MFWCNGSFSLVQLYIIRGVLREHDISTQRTPRLPYLIPSHLSCSSFLLLVSGVLLVPWHSPTLSPLLDTLMFFPKLCLKHINFFSEKKVFLLFWEQFGDCRILQARRHLCILYIYTVYTRYIDETLDPWWRGLSRKLSQIKKYIPHLYVQPQHNPLGIRKFWNSPPLLKVFSTCGTVSGGSNIVVIQHF